MEFFLSLFWGQKQKLPCSICNMHAILQIRDESGMTLSKHSIAVYLPIQSDWTLIGLTSNLYIISKL